MEKVTFEIRGTEYQLPTFLSIQDYVKIYNIKDYLGEEYFQAKLINMFTGAKLEDVLRVGHSQINFISGYLTNLFPDNTYPFFDRFTLKGVEYGFIPSWKEMSFGEFVDLDTLMTKKPEEVINNLHIICAIMYRPIVEIESKHKFKIEEYDASKLISRSELFQKELDVKYVLGGNFFFSTFVTKYSNPIQQYLIPKNMSIIRKTILTWKMRKTIWKILLNKRLDGSQLLIDYAMMTLQDIHKSSRPPYWKRLINYCTFWKKKSI